MYIFLLVSNWCFRFEPYFRVPCEDSVYVTQDFRSWGQGVLTFSRVFFSVFQPWPALFKALQVPLVPRFRTKPGIFLFSFSPSFFPVGCLGIEAGLKRNGILTFFPFEINFFCRNIFLPTEGIRFYIWGNFPTIQNFSFGLKSTKLQGSASFALRKRGQLCASLSSILQTSRNVFFGPF